MLEINLLPQHSGFRQGKQKKIFIGLLIIIVLGLIFTFALTYCYSLKISKSKIIPIHYQRYQNKTNFISNWHFVGYLQQGKRHWGLLDFSDGRIHDVCEGMVFMNNKIRILSINEHRVVLTIDNKKQFMLQAKF